MNGTLRTNGELRMKMKVKQGRRSRSASAR